MMHGLLDTGSEDIEALRLVVREDLQGLDGDSLDQGLAEALAGMTPEQAEDFLSTLGNVASRSLPGMMTGALAGAAGGPVGMIGGAVAGGVGSYLASGSGSGSAPSPRGPPPPRPAPPPVRPVQPPVAPVTTMIPASGHQPLATPWGGPPSPTGAPAMQLLQLLQSPQLQQAVLATVLGPFGRQSIPLGPTQPPVAPAALLNLLGVLATNVLGRSGIPFGEAEGLDEDFGSPEALMGALQEARASHAAADSPIQWLAQSGLVEA